jgi:glycosyltransferase involved in cell wall biosynthesis
MLSINIPVYNIEVTDLVLELINQAQKLNVPFEIRVYDDGSNKQVKYINEKLAKNSSFVYVELKENAGRAAIRNQMGRDARFKYLLFIDADSKIIDDNYLKTYLEAAELNCVICGGTAYGLQKPALPEKWLRWEYGRNREAISAEKRNHSKGFIITSNNFLIEKEVFERVPFRENLKSYGHEDTLLGYDLFNQGIKVKHINNPVEHTGLESAEIFLQKTKTALENLKLISEKWLKSNSTFINQVGFLSKYKKITHWIPEFILKSVFKIFHKPMEYNLTGKHPRLVWFDLYKLTFYANIKNR